MTTGLRRAVVLLLLAASAASCASGAIGRAQVAEFNEDYDRAVAEYTRLLANDPDNTEVRLALERSKLRAAQQHFTTGRRLADTGKLEEALIELQLALELNPTGGDVTDAIQMVRRRLRTQVATSREGRTEIETLIERTRDLAPPGLDLPTGLTLPSSLVFRDASSRLVFTALARFADINIVFDPAFQDAPISLDLRNTTLDVALASLTATTRTFYQVTAARTITVIPDTPAKRREYETEIVRNFFLSNVDLKEAVDLLRIVVDIRKIGVITATNTITVQDTPERVAAVGKILAAIDKARPEVMISVELLEVDRTRLKDYGLQIASPGATGLQGTAGLTQSSLTLTELVNLTQSSLALTGLPGLYYRLLKTDSNTRVLANPHIRASDGTAAQAQFGEEVPIPVTTFQPIATGGLAQQPVTSFNYRNIGVNIDIMPRIHHDDSVTLNLKVVVTSVSGSGFGDLPTFGNRAIDTTLRLKDGETNMLAGLIRDDERRTVQGIPYLSDIPLVGRLFAFNRTESQQTDIILTLTPHIVRVLDLKEEDLRPFQLGRDGGSPLLDRAGPLILQNQGFPADTAAPPTPAPQETDDQPVRPILPPSPPTTSRPPDRNEDPDR